jgi:hypothetical protein
MPIIGYYPTGFHTLPAPYVQAALLMPRLQVQGLVNFLIDSGADNTTLSLLDVERMNLDCRKLNHNSLVPVRGIAGEQHFYLEQAVVMFRNENSETYAFSIDIHIPKRGDKGRINQQRNLPSLLGRDVVNQCKLTMDFHSGVIALEPPVGTKLPVQMQRLI